MEHKKNQPSRSHGFTLIEVILALGVFLVSVMALIGLLGPMLQSIDEVEKVDEMTSIVNTVNAFLQSSPDIANDDETKFETIYQAVASDNYATIFAFRRYTGDTDTDIELAIGFHDETNAQLDESAFDNIAGPIYRIVLSASGVTPADSLGNNGERNASGVFQLEASSPDSYPEGYLALEARIYAETWNENFDPGNLPPHGGDDTEFNLDNLLALEPDFTLNTAIVR